MAAVVNREGLLVRTEIFEGNRQDVTTLEDVIGSLGKGMPEGTQQRVTIVAQQSNGHILKVRRSTTPEAKLAEIQTALGISALPVCSIKSVWLQERPPEKDPPLKSGG